MRRFAILALSFAACGGTPASDAGTLPPPDAGASVDAGSGDAGATDAGSTDAGSTDAGGTDAGGSDAGGSDAGSSDAGTCDPDAVRFEFLAAGPLAEGTLCDDLFVCATDAAEAARVMAASSVFVCDAAPEAPCPGTTCAYRDPGGPSTLDGAELAEICAVTLVSPTPDVVCVVYGP